MITKEDYKTNDERLEFIEGVMIMTQKIINDIKERSKRTGKDQDNLIKIEKAYTYDLIEQFFWGEED